MFILRLAILFTCCIFIAGTWIEMKEFKTTNFVDESSSSSDSEETSQESSSAIILSDDLVRHIFMTYMDESSQIYFYKTCKLYHGILRELLNQSEWFTLMNGRYVLNIYHAYSIYEHSESCNDLKARIQQLLLTNSFISANQDSFFQKNPDTDSSKDALTNNQMLIQLSEGVDPEIVAIFVHLYPLKMLGDFSYLNLSVPLLNRWGHVSRAERLIHLVFPRGSHVVPIVYIILDSELPTMLDYQVEKILSFSYIRINDKHQTRRVFEYFSSFGTIFEQFIHLCPDESIPLDIDLLHTLLKEGISLKEIARVALARGIELSYTFFIVPSTFVPLLLKLGLEKEQDVKDILLWLNREYVTAFWSHEMDEVAEILGYSEQFRKDLKDQLRYKLLW